MKTLIFLVLLATASALPSALKLPVPEITERESVWLRANPSGFVSKMTSRADCGAGQSMRPAIEPKDFMAFEAYMGQKLEGNAVLVNVSWCKIPVVHLAYDETKTHVFLTGINNRKSDGWIPKTAIAGVLVGVLRPE